MINTTDIYSRLNTALIKNGYHKASIEEKKEIIDVELKKYIISKLNELGKSNLLSNKEFDELSVSDLLSSLADEIPEEKHSSVLNHFIHCIINIAGNMQGFDILWWSEDDKSLIENPIISFNDLGLINEIKTHDKTSYVKTFNLVYHTFMNEFMKEEPHK